MKPVYYYIQEYLKENKTFPNIEETARKFLVTKECIRSYMNNDYKELYTREKKVLNYLETYIRIHNQTPTMLDIAKNNGFAVLTVEKIIENLIAKEKITYHNKQIKILN